MEETMQKPRTKPVVKQLEARYQRPVRELILEALQSGRSLSALAEEWGVQPVTVQRWARANGIRQVWMVDGREVVSAG